MAFVNFVILDLVLQRSQKCTPRITTKDYYCRLDVLQSPVVWPAAGREAGPRHLLAVGPADCGGPSGTSPNPSFQ